MFEIFQNEAVVYFFLFYTVFIVLIFIGKDYYQLRQENKDKDSDFAPHIPKKK